MSHHNKDKKTFNKQSFKMTKEELHEYMQHKSRGFIMPNKKGKGSFRRKSKYPQKDRE